MNVKVINGELSQKEIDAYVAYIKEHNPNETLQDLTITVKGDDIDLQYSFVPYKMERIRRITGYLVGTLDRWNNAKQAEERDRVKHGLSLR